jgi:uncharacterized protein
MLSNLLECPLDDVVIDLAVTVRFKQMSDEITLPYFVPA